MKKKAPPFAPPSPGFFLLLASILFLCTAARAVDRDIVFTYPEFAGDFYVTGVVSFAPGAVRDESGIRIALKDVDNEIAAKVSVRRRWPDGSIMSADITFAANTARRREYLLQEGEEVKGHRRFVETAVLPNVSFSVAGGPRQQETMEMEVGQINVRVDRSSSWYYYWNILPLTALIGLTCYRMKRNQRKYG